jgi:lipopolysaccharide export system protein LptA
LPSGVSLSTEGFTYSRTDGGRVQFTVHAKQTVAYKDDKYILQDVDVTIYGAKVTDPMRNIRGKHCTYDQGTNDFECTGDVEVQLDEKTTLQTQRLLYNHRDGIVTGPERVTIDQQGTRGLANSLEYGLNSGLLKLTGDVQINTADHVEIKTGATVFQQKENWATMSGGVLLKSPKGWIRGASGRADLVPLTHRPKMITIDADVSGESSAAPGKDAWNVRAGWLEAMMSPAGKVEHVRTRDNVDIQQLTGDTRKRLTGQEVDAALKDGKVDSIEARRNARMVMGSDQTLESSQISTTATGSVRTKDESVLTIGDSTIQGRDFEIENGETVVTFNTPRHATLKKSDGQESSSDQTHARFDSRENALIELVQNGNFRFHTSEYEGHAQRGRFEEGGSVVTLEGAAFVSDAEKSLDAGQIRVNQKDNSFLATRNVSTTIKNASEPTLVKAAQAEGGSDSVLYTGAVQLWRGDAYIKAGRLNASAGQRGQTGKMHADAAPGSTVQSNLHNIRASSEQLDYDDTSQVVHYIGHVSAKKQDMIMEAPDMIVNFRDKNVTEITASGGVAVTRADQHGTGEKAVYDAATDVVTLTGNAQVSGAQHSGQGTKLTIRDHARSSMIEGGNNQPTVTKHPLPNIKK